MTYKVIPSVHAKPSTFALARGYSRLEDALDDMGEGLVINHSAEGVVVVAFHEKHLRWLAAGAGDVSVSERRTLLGMTDTSDTYADRDPAVQDAMSWFEHAHLRPGPVADASAPFGALARRMVATLPDSPQLVQGLAKLLEAKDCMVRAAVRATMTAAERAEPRD